MESFSEAKESNTKQKRHRLETILQNILNKKHTNQASDIPEQIEQEHLDNLHFFESMDRINRAIQRTNNPEQMMSDVLDEVLSIFDCDRAWLVYPCDPAATSWNAPMERAKPQYPGAHALGLEVPIDADVIRVYRTILASDGPVQFHSLSEHALPSAVAKQFNEKSQIAMAIYPKGDKPYMFGLHQCSYPRVWTQQEERLLKEIGRRLADGLTSLLMYRDLKERENKYRELADSITNVFFAMDQGLKYTYWNKALENITGIRAEEALGKSHQEIFPDKPWVKRAVKVYRDVLRTQQPRTFEDEIDFRSKLLILEINAYPSMTGLSVFIKDITKQKRAEEKLKSNEEKYRAVADFTYDWETWTSPEGKYLYTSPSCERITGYKVQDFLDDPELFTKIVHPEDHENIEQHLQGAFLENSPPHYVEFRIITRSGKELWVEHICQNIFGSDGKWLGRRGSNRDITDRKKAQEALETSQLQLSQALKIAKLGYWEYDFTDNMFTFNDQFYSVYRTSAEKVGGYKMPLEKYAKAFLYPEDARNLIENMQELNNGIDALENVRGEHRVKFGDRKTGYVSVIFFIDKKDDKGRVTKIYGANQDITEQKQAQEAMRKSEERLRLMTETIEDVFWMSTPGIKEMRYISSSYEKIWGRTCESLYENPKSFMETVHPEDHKNLLDVHKTCHKSGKQYNCEYRIVPSQGQIKWISERGYPVFDENGNLRYMTGVCSDITNYKLAEEALKDSKDRLKKQAFLTKTLLDSFPCIAMLLRPETREIVTSNKAAVEVGAVSGKTCFETWAKRSEPCPWCLAPNVWKEGETQHLEVEHKDITWDAYWVPVSDDLYMHFAFDITKRKQIDKRVLEYQKQLKSLASQITLVEEKERYRIATELHDHIGQYLAVSSMKLKEIRQSIDSEETQLILNSVCEWLNHVIDETRSLTFNLSSPILYELGFERAVAAWLKDEVEKKHNIETVFESDELPKLLDDNVRILLFRSVKELLFNIVKHAQAKKIHVSIYTSNGAIQVQIQDDGIGFDYTEVLETAAVKAKFGLFSINERLEHFGGCMEIDSAPGQGTIIKLLAPLKRI